ncbi:bifunctional albaflavenone monooxygenase/terpene synthase [Streptomyces longispororuber]|uniref:bifunctional albaflavenone monooxygenase/terpene synthase n=1 Tax=Streptomyces longispororuber TaxID=68230 RepID=UPI00210BF713|nr:cytochrome P450 [Streptomyces longispororuber]MCQ4208428.1 cytochrome P450 [Streptomyces longispororuber]
MTVESTLPAPAPSTGPEQPPPAPGGAPLLGHAWNLLRDPLGFLTELRDGGDVVRLKLGPKTAYAVCDPELVATLLKSPDFLVGGPLWETMGVLLGKGVATSNGPLHRRQRRAIQPAFRMDRIHEYAVVMEDEARAMAARWSDGQTVDIGAEVFRTATRIVARSVLQVESIDERADRLSAALHTVFEGLYRRMILSFGPLYRMPLPANRRFENALADLHRLVDEIIAERRAAAASMAPGSNPDDLLAALLDDRDENGETVNEQEVHDQVVSLVVAGAENVAKTLTWTFQLLAEHPEHESRLSEELESVTRGRPVAFGDIKELAYMRNLITESMRIRPAVWILTRLAAVDTTLGGYRIPAGSDIVYSPLAMQRDPRAFHDHLAFDPDRWLPERAADVTPAAHAPFSVGNRKCPGDHFSMAELSLVLGAVVQKWRVTPAAGADGTPRIGITLQPRQALIRVEART